MTHPGVQSQQSQAQSQPQPQPTVKICGIRSTETLRLMKGLDVNHIGFVFAPSKRRVTPEEAGEWIRILDEEGFREPVEGAAGKFRTAGVFVNPAWDELEQVLAAAPLDIVQLHGVETPEFCRRVKDAFPVDVFKAVPIGEGASDDADSLIRLLQPYMELQAADAYLLDTYDPHVGGGSGRTFPWTVIEPLQKRVREHGAVLIVAGGLHADNVQELLHTYRPDGVDISSGVETNGVKDIEKIKAFVERVRLA